MSSNRERPCYELQNDTHQTSSSPAAVALKPAQRTGRTLFRETIIPTILRQNRRRNLWYFTGDSLRLRWPCVKQQICNVNWHRRTSDKRTTQTISAAFFRLFEWPFQSEERIEILMWMITIAEKVAATTITAADNSTKHDSGNIGNGSIPFVNSIHVRSLNKPA